MHDSLIINTDGGSRGNPGEAAYGFVIKTETGTLIKEVGKRIGINTNNVAEYIAVVAALEWTLENNLHPVSIHLKLDSQLIALQLTGAYRIKNEGLKPFFFRIQELLQLLKTQFQVTHIPREQNSAADELVNLALDGKI